jgi:phosphoribosylglycinamide formyltransferase-1
VTTPGTAATAQLPLVVLISGRGSNLKAILDATAAGLPAEVRCVISNRPGAGGLAYAAGAGVPTEVVDHTLFASREAFDTALTAAIDRYSPALVVLAGFMRVLGPEFVRHYRGRLINIHPALLPAFPGLDTHRRAIEAGVAEHGASVHFVTEEVDAGPVILQARVPVLSGDTPETLAARVLQQEHRIYPEAVRRLAEGRVRLDDNQVLMDGRPVAPSADQLG